LTFAFSSGNNGLCTVILVEAIIAKT